MKKITILLIMMLSLKCPLLGQNFVSNATINQEFCESSVLVIMDNKVGGINRNHDISHFKGINVTEIRDLFMISHEAMERTNTETFRQILKLKLPEASKQNVLKVVDALRYINGVEYASPNYVIRQAMEPNDSLYVAGLLWGLERIQAPEAWAYTTGSHDVRVGVIDDGIAYHADLEANWTEGWNLLHDPPEIITPSNNIAGSHGTLVAGTIGMVGNNEIGGTGVAWNVSLIPLIIDILEYSYISYAVRAMQLAHEEMIPILNFSFHGFDCRTLRRAVENYFGLFVWSAGNWGQNNDLWLEVNEIGNLILPNLIMVGAIGYNNQLGVFSCGRSSNYGARTVSIFAPGTEIYSTDLENRYIAAGGTSMAAPHVAGVAALLLSINPNLSASEMKNIILNSADMITISVPIDPDHTPTGQQIVRRLNAYRAVVATPFLITEDQTFDGSVSVLDRFYVLNNPNATLTVLNTTMSNTSNNPNFGFKVLAGTLVIENSTLNLGAGKLEALSNNSKIHIINSTLNVSSGYIHIHNNSDFTVSGSEVNISEPQLFQVTSNSKLLIQNFGNVNMSSTALRVSNSLMSLTGGSTIEFNNSSRFYTIGNSTIKGHHANDKIVLDKSNINLSAGTNIISGSSTRWGGIFLSNYRNPILGYGEVPNEFTNIIRGNITGINELVLKNSDLLIIPNEYGVPAHVCSHDHDDFVNMYGYAFDVIELPIYASIHDIGQIKVLEMSNLFMNNTTYCCNASGIYVAGLSRITLDNVKIANNACTGLVIHNSLALNTLENVEIFQNAGSGIELRRAFLDINHSFIYFNSQFGISNLSRVKSTIRGNTQFHHNGFAEITARSVGFFDFRTSWLPNYSVANPTVYKEFLSDNEFSPFLLMALGDRCFYIDVGALEVCYNNQNVEIVFFPSNSHFNFTGTTCPDLEIPHTLYYQAINHYLNKNLVDALDLVILILENHTDTIFAEYGIFLLAYINNAMGGSTDDFYTILDSAIWRTINGGAIEPLLYDGVINWILANYCAYSTIHLPPNFFDNLFRAIFEVSAALHMVTEQYDAAVIYYELLISKYIQQQSAGELSVNDLLYQLEYAYVHYMMYNLYGGTRRPTRFPRIAPRTHEEYLAIEKEILAKIFNLRNQDPEENETVPELFVFSASNFPNPFNPETSIAFTIPEDTDVSIVVYNVRGQRVRTLVNDSFERGHHNVIWNGTNENWQRSRQWSVFLSV
jgi:hypothetical protein